MVDSLELARAYVADGWSIHPIPIGKKAPVKWKDVTVTAENVQQHFNGEPQNFGGKNGAPSGNLVDLDLDCDEAVAAAKLLLPGTGWKFGRASRPMSHWVYRVEGTCKTRVFVDPTRDGEKGTILELRSTGTQTMLPGSVHPTGEPVEWQLPRGEVGVVDAGILTRDAGRCAAAGLLARHWPDGGRHMASLALGGALAKAGWSNEDTTTFVRVVAIVAHDDEVHDRVTAADNSWQRVDHGESATGLPSLGDYIDAPVIRAVTKWLSLKEAKLSPSDVVVNGFRLTDLGNAERLADRFGDDLRYVSAWKSWLYWDERRWARDGVGVVDRRAREVVRSMYAELDSVEDAQVRLQFALHAHQSENVNRLEAITKIARAHVAFAAEPADFDQNPWLLTCLNGTVDLRTGELRPHDPEDMITMICPVEYSPEPAPGEWRRFVDLVTNGDAEMAEFLQMVAGYALTGSTRESAFFFIIGETRTGKTTFIEALKGVLGDYGWKTSFDAFLAGRRPGGPRDDIAGMAGKRLVIASEVAYGRRFDEATIKELTGGDTTNARHLYEREFQFKPVFKLFLAANDFPALRSDDSGSWARLKMVPFENAALADTRWLDLKERVRDVEVTGPEILSWAVEGCLKWQERGSLPLPQKVEDRSTKKREEFDPLTDFIADRCSLGDDCRVLRSDLYEAYIRWARDMGERLPVSRNKFIALMRARGFHEVSSNGVKWVGIELKQEAF